MHARRRTIATVCLAAVTSGIGFILAEDVAMAQTPAPRYEVWTVDQSDTRGAKHGGALYVFAGSDLDAGNPSGAKPAHVVDLAGATSAMCLERTGANPVRPHMLLFNRDNTHALLAFVASGHVVIFDARTREPIECVRTSQSPSGQQAHAAFPSPDGSYVLVANQNGKRLERIDADFAAGRFVPNPAATLDLATCTTPSGAACQAPGVRPDNAPICPVISGAGDLAFVTLRGGGMLVVDPRPTPMRIVAEYDMATVKGNGCGGVQVGNGMYVNSGGRPGPLEHLHVYGFDVYRFALASFDAARPSTAPNAPAPTVVFTAEGEHDSHGMIATGGGAYIWVADRHADVIEILATADNSRVRTVPLNGGLTNNAAPDLIDISPRGDRVFVAFRGPTPLSGDPHNATGSTPGLAVLEVIANGQDARIAGLIRLTNVGTDGVERADPHALRVRRIH
jgi:DNA-binding beta-propeller fold protein YncE